MTESGSSSDEGASDSTLWQGWRETPDEEPPTVGVSPPGDASSFRAAYGLLRGPLKRRSDQFTSLGGWLAQAQFSQTPDEYLARAIRRSLVITAVAVALLVVLFGGVVPRVDALGLLSGYAALSALTVATLVGLTGGVFVVALLVHYYYPLVWAVWRRRHINADLSYAIVYIYVLSEAGLNLPEIMRRVADSEETYGEVAREFRGIVVDMDRFGVDTLSALDEAKRRTPSTELAEFLDDIGNVIESGGHLDSFLKSRSEKQLREARQRQENLIETIATVVEGYITLVFAGPIFLITILIILGFVGTSTIVFVNLTTYLLIPAGILGFLVFFNLFNRPYERPLTIELETDEETDGSVTNGKQVSAYRRASRIKSFREFLKQPVVSMQQQPVLSLFLTVPAAVLALVGIVVTGVATPTEYSSDAVRTTTMLVVVPLLIPSFGLMFATESERRRKKAVRRRLPEVLRGLASSSKNGVLLPDAIGLAARRSEGALAAYLKRVDNDIRVTGNVPRSIREFAAEVGVNRVTRASKILIEGHRTSGRLSTVLGIIGEDAEERHRLDVQWRHEMQPYVAFFMIGVIVYLAIVLIFLEVFFPILTDVGTDAFSGPASFGSGDVSLPIDAYKETLYHSLLIQAFGNGLVMGKLVDGNLLSGLKYANPLILVMVVVFYVI